MLRSSFLIPFFMHFQIHTPTVMPATLLDDYLSKGWFRIKQTIITVDMLPGKEDLHLLYWIRYVLHDLEFGKRQMKIFRKNQRYKITNQPALITPEMETLYSNYLTGIDFNAPPSLHDALFSSAGVDIYQTRMLQVREDERLIAVGFYDVGANSVAGILNCYHPAYKKQSLGIYLLLLQIMQAKQMGMSFYYPGYIAEDFAVFDYKLFPAPQATEIFDTTNSLWLPYINNPIFTL